MVCHRALLVERFLNWAQADGVITNSPFKEWHRRYGPRTAPIVRALVSDDPQRELGKLQLPARFGSFLGKTMKNHVTLMRSLGYRYKTNEGALLRFDRFLQQSPDLEGKPLNELISAWSDADISPGRLREAYKVGRVLSKAMHRLDPTIPVLPVADVEARASKQDRRPQVYSDEQIQLLLQTALTFPSPKAPLRPLTLYTMLVLAYCAGLRRREIAHLKLGDIDLQNESIDIRDTKFFKHRRLPLATGVMDAIKHYLAVRQTAGAPTATDSCLFWNQRLGKAYTYGTTWHLLVKVIRRAGIKPIRGRAGPRIHDLRHSMVSHRMRDWYKEGVNPESNLPHLATYLGHNDINSTLVYLNSTPELLHEASERFRKHGVTVVSAPRSAT
jgi:integrase